MKFGRVMAGIYVQIASITGKNTIEHHVQDELIQYKFSNVPSFTSARNAFKNGKTSEGLNIEIFDRGDDCDAVIDVGAHYGIYSVLMGVLNPGVQLYSYEPADEPRSKLIKNLSLNGLEPKANISDSVVLNTSGDAMPFFEDPESGSQQHSITDEKLKMTTTKRTIALSDMFNDEGIKSPFLKIDAEGAEEYIAEDLVSQSFTTGLSGVMEIHPDKLSEHTEQDIIELFQSSNFTFEKVCESDPDYRHSRPVYWFKQQ